MAFQTFNEWQATKSGTPATRPDIGQVLAGLLSSLKTGGTSRKVAPGLPGGLAGQLEKVGKIRYKPETPSIEEITKALPTGGREFFGKAPVIGPTLGGMAESFLKGPTTLVQEKPAIEKLGDIASTIGFLKKPFIGPAFGAFSAGLKAVTGAPGEEVKKAYQEAIPSGYQFAAISDLTAKALGPAINKLTPTQVGDINKFIDAARQAPTEAARKELIHVAWMEARNRIAKAGITGGIGFGAVGAVQPAKNLEERFKKTITQGIMGFVFGAGLQTAGLGLQVAGGQVIKPGVEAVKQRFIERATDTVLQDLQRRASVYITPEDMRLAEIKPGINVKELIKEGYDLGTIQKASQRANGLGLLADYDNAAKAGNTALMKDIAAYISNVPKSSPYASYKESMRALAKETLGGTGAASKYVIPSLPVEINDLADKTSNTIATDISKYTNKDFNKVLPQVRGRINDMLEYLEKYRNVNNLTDAEVNKLFKQTIKLADIIVRTDTLPSRPDTIPAKQIFLETIKSINNAEETGTRLDQVLAIDQFVNSVHENVPDSFLPRAFKIQDPVQTGPLVSKFLDFAREGTTQPITQPAIQEIPRTVTEETRAIQKSDQIIKKYMENISMEPPTEKPKGITTRLEGIYTKVVDRLFPITRAQRGIEVPPGQDVRYLTRRYYGIEGIAKGKLFYKTFRLDPNTGDVIYTGDGLSKVLDPVKDNVDDLRTLMVAQREIELSGRGIKGVNPRKSAEVIAALKEKNGADFGLLQQTANNVRDWTNRAILDPLREIGAISEKQYTDITNSNQFYVPFSRVIQEIETRGFVPKNSDIFNPRGLPIKKILGSERQIIDPLESLITNTYKFTDFVERARVSNALVGLRDFSDDLAETIKPISPKMVPVAKEAEKTIFRPSIFQPAPNVLTVFEEGKRKLYQVPRDIYEAMTGVQEADVGTIMRIIAYPAKVLRVGATLAPEFTVRNPIRDQFSAFTYSKYGFVPGWDFFKGLFSAINKDDLYWKWAGQGGEHSMLVSLDRLTSQTRLEEVLGKQGGVQGAFEHPFDALQKFSEFTEKATRIGVAGRALSSDAPITEAIYQAREATTDFARRGSQTKALNLLIAFWNANVQGMDRMARAFKDTPGTTSLKLIGGITLPSILLYEANKDNPRYQELPQWQRDLFWTIIPPGTKSPIIRIPKPFELGIIFGSVPEHILSYIDKKDPEALTKIANPIVSAATPGFVPTVLQPIVENVANYRFFTQRPVVPRSQENLPPEMQAGPGTSEIAKTIGRTIKYSPSKIENLWLGYTASLGRSFLNIADAVLQKLGVVGTKAPVPTRTLADIPVLRAFIAREPIGPSSESVNRFYDMLERTRQARNGLTDMIKRGQGEQAKTYAKDHPEFRLNSGMESTSRTLVELRQRKDTIYESRTLTSDQKREAIDNLDIMMTEIAKRSLIIYDKVTIVKAGEKQVPSTQIPKSIRTGGNFQTFQEWLQLNRP